MNPQVENHASRGDRIEGNGLELKNDIDTVVNGNSIEGSNVENSVGTSVEANGELVKAPSNGRPVDSRSRLHTITLPTTQISMDDSANSVMIADRNCSEPDTPRIRAGSMPRGEGLLMEKRLILMHQDESGLHDSCLALQVIPEGISTRRRTGLRLAIDQSNDGPSIARHGRHGVGECCGKFRKVLPCCAAEERAESLADWLILCSVLLFNVCSGICLTGFSVLYRDMALTFDANMAAVGWIPGIQFCVACILGIFFSYPINLYGCRISAAIGSFIVTLGIVLSSLSPNIIWMYLLYGLVAGVGNAMTALTQSVIVQQRFNANRGLATGISTLGFTVGNFCGAPVTSWLLGEFGLRGALLLQGGILAHRIPLGLMFHTPRHMTGVKKSSAEEEVAGAKKGIWQKISLYFRSSLDFAMFRHVTFTLFCFAGFLHKFLLHSYVSHLASYGIYAGLSWDQAVWSISVISISAFVCRQAAILF